MDKSDPTGMYDCAGSNTDCAVISHFVSAINKAMANSNPDSDAGKELSTISQYLGKPGDDNGVTIQATSLTGVVSEARQNNTIAIDVGKAKDITTNGLARANPGKSAGDLRNAQGGGRIAHEAQNEIGMKKSGAPQSKASEKSLEKSAFGAESYVYKGLGVNSGILAPGAIDAYTGKAANAWCTEAAGQGWTPTGC